MKIGDLSLVKKQTSSQQIGIYKHKLLFAYILSGDRGTLYSAVYKNKLLRTISKKRGKKSHLNHGSKYLKSPHILVLMLQPNRKIMGQNFIKG